MMYKLTKNKNMKLLSWNCHGSLPDEYTSLQKAIKEKRNVCFDKIEKKCCIYDRELLLPTLKIAGPCIIEEYGSTTLVPPSWIVEKDEIGNLLLYK